MEEKIREFLESRDYKNTWKRRLKDCIAYLTIIHLLACLLIPAIRDWTLELIILCNEEYFLDYFNSLLEAQRAAPPPEPNEFEAILEYLIFKKS